jgi:outer membrane protein assembly factor BamA
VLHRNNIGGHGSVFSPVGRLFNPGTLNAPCRDDPFTVPNAQGNKNGRCNDLTDTKIEDFDDLNETDVIGGNKFVLMNFEYRLPLSQEVGLQAVIFFDMGQSFAEGDSLFNISEWRYSYGGGLLWFSPFGPLQIVLGFPINPLSIEKSPVFEFSVGGFVQ